MIEVLRSPSQTQYWFLPGRLLFLCIALAGFACFAYIVSRRLQPLMQANADLRFDHPRHRITNVLRYWMLQWKQPRYPTAGLLHIAIFAGFLLLAARSTSMVMLGIAGDITGSAFVAYDVIVNYAATVVLVAVLVAAVRRIVFKPSRYAVPPQYGKDHTSEAVFVLGLIATLMISASLFEASRAAVARTAASGPLSLAWLLTIALHSASHTTLQRISSYSYLVHDLTFFGFLCFLPMGKHFHVVTSLFNVYFAKLERGSIKPVRWGVSDAQLDQVKSFGVKTFADFTWKHLLDFYSCADCGRCSDNCPANAAGRPLSPRFLTIKAREYSFEHFPLVGSASNGQPLVGNIYGEDEIWSCTTCGACEQECPLLNEYIDKIVDLRRGLIDDGNVPKSIQKALKAVESRGNPYGKLEKKRGDWTKEKTFRDSCEVKLVGGGEPVDTLYFVDSITSFDDRMQSIARATARILSETGEKFAVLGAAEKDSGHDVRRFGEEMLFQELRDTNTEAIRDSGATRIVTSDPHAYNALKHDYQDVPPVEHISEVVARAVAAGRLTLAPATKNGDVYAYHDPCYLGRHNQVYDQPREVLDAIPGLKRVEMDRSRDRSFCCGGGGLMLFYEPQEEERMGVKRVRMAADAGANVIVTACPFCLVNIEDAIKVAGLENSMRVQDLTEVVDEHLAADAPQRPSIVETTREPLQV